MIFQIVEIGASNLKIADGNYSAKYPRSDEFLSKGIPFIRANNFLNKSIIDNKMYFISEEKHSELKKGHLKAKDVLITTRGKIGEVALVPKNHDNSNINAQIVLLRCNEGWHPEYLLHALTSDFVRRQFPGLTTGTALKQLPVKNLRKIKIPLPPLAEQQQIAAILDAADSLRQRDQQLIDYYTALSHSLFLDMFGDPMANPYGWNISPLSEVIKTGPQNGLYKPSKDYGSGIPIIRIDSFHNDVVRTAQLKRVNINDDEMKSFKIIEGDFVINRVNSPSHLGKCGLVPAISENMVFESNMMRVTFDDTAANNSYMLFILSSRYLKRQILNASKDAVNQSSINQKDVNNFTIPLPPLALQTQFAERLAIIEQQKQQAQASLEKSDALFNSLLQRAFSGELTAKKLQVA